MTYDHRTMSTAEGRLQHHMGEIAAIRAALESGYLSAQSYRLVQQDLKAAMSHTRTFVRAAKLEQGTC